LFEPCLSPPCTQEGLLERDYATNAPFYARFGVRSAKDLQDESASIVYVLKRDIQRHFLRRMVKGKLDEVL
jgi:hypothetical protein